MAKITVEKYHDTQSERVRLTHSSGSYAELSLHGPASDTGMLWIKDDDRQDGSVLAGFGLSAEELDALRKALNRDYARRTAVR